MIFLLFGFIREHYFQILGTTHLLIFIMHRKLNLKNTKQLPNNEHDDSSCDCEFSREACGRGGW
jgi:hypothetical protein